MANRPEAKNPADREVSTKEAVDGALSRPSWLSRDGLLGLLLMLAVGLAYLPVCRAGFFWDDASLVTTNPCIIGPLGLKEIWTTRAADICPLTLTTFWAEHALWGLAPLPYHVVNVLLHGAGAVVLWRVLRRLRAPGAWLGAAIWALHPLQVESVAWISEMKNTQSGLFFLLSILFFARWLKVGAPDGPTGGGWNYGLTLLFAALAMASKSSTVILPVVLCLCAWWMEGRWLRRNLARVAPVVLMSVAATALSIGTVKLEAGGDTSWVPGWPERAAMAGDAIWFYLGKLVWPHPLIVVYPSWPIDPGQWFSYLPVLAVLTAALLLWRQRDAWARPWFFAFAYFVAALLPVLGWGDIPIFRYSPAFDHLQYLAGMGPLALVGAGLVRWADGAMPGKPGWRSSLGAGVLLVLGLLSWHRAWAYESEETLWADTLAKNPGCWVAHNNLGIALAKRGRLDEAMTQFQTALDLNPNYAEPHNSLGLALLQKGRLDEAMDQYRKALAINSQYADPQNNLGLVLMQKGQVDEAMAHFQTALEINPNDAETHNNLGNALFQNGQVDEAIAHYQKALAIDPDLAETHDNLGRALLQEGRSDEAMPEFQKALEIDPNNADAHNNLGIALAQKGRLDEARAQFQEALRLKPGDSKAQNNLAKAQAMEGQPRRSK